MDLEGPVIPKLRYDWEPFGVGERKPYVIFRIAETEPLAFLQ